ncbi:MAG: hypothetical protein WAU47_07350 [Desulfobaccales bacterium]
MVHETHPTGIFLVLGVSWEPEEGVSDSWILCPGEMRFAYEQVAATMKERTGGTGVLTCAGARLEPRCYMFSFSEESIFANSLADTTGQGNLLSFETGQIYKSWWGSLNLDKRTAAA